MPTSHSNQQVSDWLWDRWKEHVVTGVCSCGIQDEVDEWLAESYVHVVNWHRSSHRPVRKITDLSSPKTRKPSPVDLSQNTPNQNGTQLSSQNDAVSYQC